MIHHLVDRKRFVLNTFFAPFEKFYLFLFPIGILFFFLHNFSYFQLAPALIMYQNDTLYTSFMCVVFSSMGKETNNKNIFKIEKKIKNYNKIIKEQKNRRKK